jgi:hypothetical protein
MDPSTIAITQKRVGSPFRRWITHDGKTQCITWWARELDLSPSTIAFRLAKGQPVKRALRGERDRSGRPRIGSTKLSVRMPPPQLARLKAWIKAQPDKPTLPEALRRLADKAMSCKGQEA